MGVGVVMGPRPVEVVVDDVDDVVSAGVEVVLSEVVDSLVVEVLSEVVEVDDVSSDGVEVGESEGVGLGVLSSAVELSSSKGSESCRASIS